MAIPPGRAFLPPITITHATWAKKIVLGRFTRGGLLDFAVLHWETGGRCNVEGTNYGKGFLVRPFINTSGGGSTSFAAAPKLEFIDDADRIYDMYPSDAAVGDVNGDGLDDIVVANAHADRLFVYLSNGDGTFQAPIEITDTGGDDASYITLGHFSGSGKLDAAVLNIRRHDPAPGMNFEWKFAFLFGNGDGTFQTPIVLDEGDWSFGGDADDGGGYYKSNTFQMTTMKRGVVIGLRGRDAVSFNGVMRWWDDVAIQTDGKKASNGFKRSGSDTFAFYGPPRSDIALFGGQLILTSFNKPAEMTAIPLDRGSAENLNAAWPEIGRYSGEHFLMADFDNDGLLDIVRFRDRDLPSNYSDDKFIAVFGSRPDQGPLMFDRPKPHPDRVKFFQNPSGFWHRGHRAWKAAAGDFDGDGYLDLITLTNAGVVVHTNIGSRPVQFTPLRITQWRPVPTSAPPHTVGGEIWYTDEVEVNFQAFDNRAPNYAFFRPTGGPPDDITALATFGAELTKPPMGAGTGRAFFHVPDEGTLPLGTYDMTLYDGIVESSNSVPVKVSLTPVILRTVTFYGPKKSAAGGELVLGGFFGAPADFRDIRFFVEENLKPATRFEPRVVRLTETTAAVEFPATRPFGVYDVIAMHPTRGTSNKLVTISPPKPVIVLITWLNRDGAPVWGELGSGGPSGSKLRPNAYVEVQAANLYAPDTKEWELVDGRGAVVHSGTGLVAARGGLANDNSRGVFVIQGFPGVSPGNFSLRVKSTLGQTSDPFGPLPVDKPHEMPPPKPGEMTFFIGVEHRSAFGFCNLFEQPAEKLDSSDPMKPGALQKVKAKFLIPDEYIFKDLPDRRDRCYGRRWDYTFLEDEGGEWTSHVTAITQERAELDIKARHKPGEITSITQRMGDP